MNRLIYSPGLFMSLSRDRNVSSLTVKTGTRTHSKVKHASNANSQETAEDFKGLILHYFLIDIIMFPHYKHTGVVFFFVSYLRYSLSSSACPVSYSCVMLHATFFPF
uniref:Uncharacterized protein n=1 Tax=Periophthalmus magnuspinnatus TaxID=409849 RepID=A0A3B4AQ65_9GOBI